MRLFRGNMWDMYPDEWVFATGNSYLGKSGRVVMGRGAALEMNHRFPNIAKEWGDFIKGSVGPFGFYGVVYNSELGIGLVQIKRNYKENAKYNYIEKSFKQLDDISQLFQRDINVNFPGTGAGNLSRKFVLPLLVDLELSDRIKVWEYEK